MRTVSTSRIPALDGQRGIILIRDKPRLNLTDAIREAAHLAARAVESGKP